MLKGGFFTVLMSNVLASVVQPDGVLLTGFCNPQVVLAAQTPAEAVIVLVRRIIPVNMFSTKSFKEVNIYPVVEKIKHDRIMWF